MLRHGLLVCILLVAKLSFAQEFEFLYVQTNEVSLKFVSGTSVVFYDFAANKAGFEVALCAGLDEGVKLMGIGASVKMQGCVKMKMELPVDGKARDKAEAERLVDRVLKSDSFKKQFVRAFRQRMENASDDALKSIGISREQVKKITDVTFGDVEDKTSDKDEIEKQLKALSPVPATRAPNS